MAVLIGAMLFLLIVFFVAFAGLVCFAEHVIRPRGKAALTSDPGFLERAAGRGSKT